MLNHFLFKIRLISIFVEKFILIGIMWVVVYLVDAKKQIIVPQEWIMSLDQEVLNNNGKNCNQNRRVFWSSAGLHEDIPDATIAPNFSLAVSNVFPPAEIQACFIARIKRFCSTVERAKNFRDFFRSQMPAVYNPVREWEVPIPPTSPAHENVNYGRQLKMEVLNAYDEASIHGQNNQIADRSQDAEVHNGYNEPNENQIYDLDEEIENKPDLPLANIVLNETDSLAVDDIFANENEQVSEGNEENQGIAVLENETTFYENGVLKVLRRCGSLEMIYNHGDIPMPKPPERFVVKRNDIISRNYPFEENENGDRGYSVQVGNEFKEVKLPRRVVDGLSNLNGYGKRDDVSEDSTFVKGLLVGLFGVKNIKAGPVDKHVVRFVKELFSYRVDGNDMNGSRYTGFNKLCDTALYEIRNDLYKKKRV